MEGVKIGLLDKVKKYVSKGVEKNKEFFKEGYKDFKETYHKFRDTYDTDSTAKWVKDSLKDEEGLRKEWWNKQVKPKAKEYGKEFVDAHKDLGYGLKTEAKAYQERREAAKESKELYKKQQAEKHDLEDKCSCKGDSQGDKKDCCGNKEYEKRKSCGCKEGDPCTCKEKDADCGCREGEECKCGGECDCGNDCKC